MQGLINTVDNIYRNKNSRYNTSERIRNSYTKEKRYIMQKLRKMCNKESVTLLDVAYGFLKITSKQLNPIIGGRTEQQVNELIAIMDSNKLDKKKRVETVLTNLNEDMSYNFLKYPLTAFEK